MTAKQKGAKHTRKMSPVLAKVTSQYQQKLGDWLGAFTRAGTAPTIDDTETNRSALRAVGMHLGACLSTVNKVRFFNAAAQTFPLDFLTFVFFPFVTLNAALKSKLPPAERKFKPDEKRLLMTCIGTAIKAACAKRAKRNT